MWVWPIAFFSISTRAVVNLSPRTFSSLETGCVFVFSGHFSPLLLLQQLKVRSNLQAHMENVRRVNLITCRYCNLTSLLTRGEGGRGIHVVIMMYTGLDQNKCITCSYAVILIG